MSTPLPDFNSLDSWYNQIQHRLRPSGRDIALLTALRQRALSLSESLNPPVLIVGTSGKTSLTWAIEATLAHQGQASMAFTSPHVYSVRERIRIGDRPVSETELKDAYEAQREFLAEHDAGFFDILFLCAVQIAAWQNLQMIMEAGVGARLDVTNFHPAPRLVLISAMGLDHEDVLGQGIEAIAQDKLSAIRPGLPARIFPQANIGTTEMKQILSDRGDHVVWSQATTLKSQAGEALSDLGFDLSEAEIQVPPLPGRLEVFKANEQTWVFDMAHNLDKLRFLIREAPVVLTQALAIVSIQSKKNVAGFFRLLRATVQDVVLLPLDHADFVSEFEGVPTASLEAAVAQGLDHSGPVLVTGSAYHLGPVKSTLEAKLA